GLHGKLRVGTVLAATVRNGIINHHDLAVISDVDPAFQYSEQNIADALSTPQLHARLGHRSPVRAANEISRAQVIDDHAAGYAPLCGSYHGMRHLAAVPVGQPDVEQQVHVV